MKKKLTALIIGKLHIVLVLLAVQKNSFAQSGLCCPYAGWNYILPIEFTNQSGNAFVNSQIPFIINTATPISQGKMKPDGSDIRFYINCGQYLDYWIESGINSANTKIWVRIPNVPDGSTVTIYMLYGNPSAAAVSNQATLFPNVVNINGGNISGTTTADWINISGNVTMSAGQPAVLAARKIVFNANFNGAGLGYGPQAGPGAGINGGGSRGGSGGSYGGAGGSGGGGVPPTYGTPNGPDIDMGSGGGGSDCPATASGGGAISLIGADVSVNGNINVRGADDQYAAPGTRCCCGGTSEAAGGGAGGGVLIQGFLVSGSASINASGGNGGNSDDKESGGGGGGGRVKIRWCQSNTFNGNVVVSGGLRGPVFQQAGSQNGQDGTYTQPQISCYQINILGEQPVSIPTASFTFNNACLGNAINFNNTSTSAPVSTTLTSSWTFGDGTSSTLSSPSKTYSNANTYNVTLTVTSQTGCTASTSQQVTVAPNPTADFNSTTVCENNPVSFTDISTGNPVQWNWNFGGGNTSNQQNPSFTFNGHGTFPVTLTVTNAGGCSGSITKNVTVNPGVRADFTFSNKCVNSPINFNNTSAATTGVILSNLWLFGDGNSSTASSPSHTYASAGSYNVMLIIRGSNGCTDTITKTTEAYPKPVADFTAGDTCFGFPTRFTDVSTISNGTIVQWSWNFGNGATSNQQNPIQNYSSAGLYNVKLIVFSNNNCVDSISKQIRVHYKPDADFSSPPACFPNASQFTDASTVQQGSIVQWQWDMGDGNNFSTQNPSHNYSAPGNYGVKLEVTTNAGCKDTVAKQIQVYPKPDADFTVADVCRKNPSIFTDASVVSSGSITSRQWNFGDGNTSTQTNPQHVYASSGTFNVTLVVTTSAGCRDTVVRSALVHPTPTSAFTAYDLCVGDFLQFTDNSSISSGEIHQWSWDFKDGNTSNAQNPQHAFTNPGTYRVRLITTSDLNCRDTIEKDVTVFPNPVADFSASAACLNNPSNFNDLSTVSSGTINTWRWHFGDGNVSSVKSPTHTYTSQGTYEVKLVVLTDKGCSDSINKNIEVYPRPDAQFTSDSVCLYNENNFTDLSSSPNGNIIKRAWNFGDGNSATTANPKHKYATPGTYTVILTVTDNNNCTASVSGAATVYPLPLVDFSAPENCADKPAIFTNTTTISSGSVVNFLWDFGDGSPSSSETNPQHIYSNPGTYNLTLEAFSDRGCQSAVRKTHTVNPIPVISVITSPACFAEPSGKAMATAAGGTPPYSYLWSNNMKGSSIENVYAGNYAVTVTDNKGCTSAATAVVAEPVEPLYIFSEDETYQILPGEKVFIKLTSNYDSVSYQVFPSIYTSCANCAQFEVKPTNTITYRITATDNKGCRGEKELTVFVKDDLPIYIPNAFSPNNDGRNDLFKVYTMAVKLFELKIFNRWGEKVFESTDPELGWDGYYNGSICEPGVYSYVLTVTFLNNLTEKRRGSFVLLK
ncbi:MAG: DUF2341 domain-containing protein [Chitinophagales bacterium]|nr:DUF2341 domain-containing protein [Chitinophagales bacterium]MDW8273500.1 DUF2341 domain-containing protein [Chitinophagales bacterium]